MGSLGGVGHQKAPGTAQLRVNITVGCNTVVLECFDETINTLGIVRVVFSFDDIRLKCGVIHNKLHIGIRRGDDPDIIRCSKSWVKTRKREPLVSTYYVYPEAAGFFDKWDTNCLIIQPPAAIRGIDFPRRNILLFNQALHALELSDTQIRHYQTMDQESV